MAAYQNGTTELHVQDRSMFKHDLNINTYKTEVTNFKNWDFF
jgi:hypothetical protein